MSLINSIKNHYYDIPEPILQLAGAVFYKIPRDYRYGKTFLETTRLLKKMEYYSENEIKEIVNENFSSIVKYAYKHVPFYKKLYDEHNVDISKIKGINDIVKLPFIDKDTIRDHAFEMISNDVNKSKLMYITTSGSTGNPVGFYQLQEMTMIEWAYTLHIWSRVGYKPESSRLVLRGKKIRNQKNSNWYYDPLRRELSCNIFDLSDSNIELYIQLIEKYKPEFIHGYMSAIFVIAKYMESKRIVLKHNFKAILATSENILPIQREFVERIFNIRVFSFYGHSERLIIAGECENSHCYHVEPSYGYCEIVDQFGEQAKSGEIVATGFLNYAMPLIRYKTGDVGTFGNNNCTCNRHYQNLEEVSGRWHQDMLVNSDGTFVSLTALNIHTKELDKVKRYKIIQNEKGIVKMQIMPFDELTTQDKKAIKEVFEEKTKGKIIFEIDIVRNITLQKNGKYRIIEQNIKV